VKGADPFHRSYLSALTIGHP